MAQSPASQVAKYIVGFLGLVGVLALFQWYSSQGTSADESVDTPLGIIEVESDTVWSTYRNSRYGYFLEYPKKCRIHGIQADVTTSPSITICGFDTAIIDVLETVDLKDKYPDVALSLDNFVKKLHRENRYGVLENPSVTDVQKITTAAGKGLQFSMEGTYRDFSGQKFPFASRSTLTFFGNAERKYLLVTRNDDHRANRIIESFMVIQ
jgi:hypothetical protein